MTKRIFETLRKRDRWQICFVIQFAVAAMLFLAGCASPNVNPAAAKKGAGYADFYCDSTNRSLAWYIAEVDATGKGRKELFSTFDPLEEPIVRLKFTPGRHHVRVTFLNQVIVRKGEIDIEIQEGKITPVRVAFAAAGTTLVERKEYSIGPTLQGHGGRTTAVGNYETVMWAVELKGEEAVPYQTKEKMPYVVTAGK